MSKPILYSIDLSPPARAVRLVADYIGLELDIQNVDLFSGEHLKEPFLQINPQHTVPTLIDDGEAIWDSHAICAYIVGKYADDDSLYPTDLLTRARVDQRLHFDSGVLFPAVRGANVPIFQGKREVPEERLKAINDAYDLLEKFLETDEYLVGNDLTIADFCALCTVSTLRLHAPLDPDTYPKILGWIERLSQIPAYDDLIVRVSAEFTALLDQRRGTAEE